MRRNVDSACHRALDSRYLEVPGQHRHTALVYDAGLTLTRRSIASVEIKMLQRLSFSLSVILVASLTGCLPPEPPPLEGPLSRKEANGKIFAMHAAHGNIYSVDHVWNGKKFKANWELANIIKKRAQLQIKPPTDSFSETDLYMALLTALDDEEHSPWHNIADDTIAKCFRGALFDDETNMDADLVPQAPYEVTVKVKKYSKEWFCQVTIQNMMNPDSMPDLR